MPPIGLAMKPAAKVKRDKIKAVEGVASPKNAVGNIKAAAAPYRKKSYHSILVPANAVKATFCMFDSELSNGRMGSRYVKYIKK